MALIDENGLFKPVLRAGNAGSIRIPWSAAREKTSKCKALSRQIEYREFTQSWIVMVHFSRAGNVW